MTYVEKVYQLEDYEARTREDIAMMRYENEYVIYNEPYGHDFYDVKVQDREV